MNQALGLVAIEYHENSITFFSPTVVCTCYMLTCVIMFYV